MWVVALYRNSLIDFNKQFTQSNLAFLAFLTHLWYGKIAVNDGIQVLR